MTVVTPAGRNEQFKTERSTHNPVMAFDDLNVSPVSSSHRDRLRQVLSEFITVLDGSLGKSSTNKHQIDLLPNNKPLSHSAYKTGPEGREAKATQVILTIRAVVIEPAQSRWNSPVVLVL